MSQSIGQTSTNGALGAASTSFGAGTPPTWPGNTTGGSNLALVLGFTQNPGTITVTGWTQHGATRNNGTNCYTAVFEQLGATAQTSGTGPTISWTNSVDAAACAMIELKGTATVSPQDGTDSNATGSTTAPAGGSLGTSNANDILLGAIAQAGAGSILSSWSAPLPSGASVISTAVADNVTGHKHYVRAGFVYQVLTGTTTATPSVTSTAADPWAGVTYAVEAPGTTSALCPQPVTSYAGVWKTYRDNPFDFLP